MKASWWVYILTTLLAVILGIVSILKGPRRTRAVIKLLDPVLERNYSAVHSLVLSLAKTECSLYSDPLTSDPTQQQLAQPPPPAWWVEPRQCQSLSASCNRTGKSGQRYFEASLGAHICALDTCVNGSAELLWSRLQPSGQWAAMLDLLRLMPRNVVIFAMGDSTAGQQVRSLKCMLEEIGHTISQSLRTSQGECTVFTDGEDTSIHRVVCFRSSRFLTTDLAIRSNGNFKGEVLPRAIIEGVLKARSSGGITENDADAFLDDAHVAFVLMQGAWSPCKVDSCFSWHDDYRDFQHWWRERHFKNATLIIRDPLPQHFQTPDLRYDPTVPMEQASCRPFEQCASSGHQAVKLRDYSRIGARLVETALVVDAPESGLRRLPIWGLTARMAQMHNVRSGDCTHYCVAMTALWNGMMAHIIVEQTSGSKIANAEGGAQVAALITRSMDAARVDMRHAALFSFRDFVSAYFDEEMRSG